MAVAGQHLRGRYRPQAQPLADVALHRRVDVGVGADGAGELPDAHGVAGADETVAVAPHLQGPQGQLGAHGGGLGVDAVGPADHRHVAQLPGPGGDCLLERRGGVDEEGGGPGQGEGEGGVDDVG